MVARGNGWAKAIGALSICFVLASLALAIAGQHAGLNMLDPVEASLLGMIAGFAVVGAVIAIRRPENHMGWVFLIAALVYALEMFVNAYADYAVLGPRDDLPAGLWAGWLSDLLWFPANALTMVVVFVRFPDGQPMTARWRQVERLAAVLCAVTVAAGAFHPGNLSQPLDAYANPLGLEGAGWLNWVMYAAFAGILGLWLVSIGALAVRYRRGGPVERAQLRWFGLAAALAPAGLLLLFVSDWAGGIAMAAALLALPASVGVAILRYRLYDIDLVIRKTLVYAVLLASLAVVYLGGVAVLGAAFRSVTGQSGTLAITLTTLAVAAAFQPLRRRIQHGVDRRFAREPYDAAATVAGLASRLRDGVDLGTIEADVVGAVRGTLRPQHVDLWIRRPGSW
jgi:hypothetical protein